MIPETEGHLLAERSGLSFSAPRRVQIFFQVCSPLWLNSWRFRLWLLLLLFPQSPKCSLLLSCIWISILDDSSTYQGPLLHPLHFFIVTSSFIAFFGKHFHRGQRNLLLRKLPFLSTIFTLKPRLPVNLLVISSSAPILCTFNEHYCLVLH